MARYNGARGCNSKEKLFIVLLEMLEGEKTDTRCGGKSEYEFVKLN